MDRFFVFSLSIMFTLLRISLICLRLGGLRIYDISELDILGYFLTWPFNCARIPVRIYFQWDVYCLILF